MAITKAFHLKSWIDENRHLLKPPVGNKMIYTDNKDFIVMEAYVFPFILVISTLIVCSVFLPEWLAGILGILILVPYYFGLYMLRNTFKKNFQISIIKT